MIETTTQPIERFYFPLTRPEIEVLLGLIDLGVQKGGLAVAANAGILHKKIQDAKPIFADSPTKQPTESETR
jgi:hypothetical protein